MITVHRINILQQKGDVASSCILHVASLYIIKLPLMPTWNITLHWNVTVFVLQGKLLGGEKRSGGGGKQVNSAERLASFLGANQ